MPPPSDRPSRKFWTDDSPVTMRQIFLLLLVGGAGFSIGGGYFALRSHAQLDGHPVIVKEVREDREKQRDAMAKLTQSVNALNLTMKLQGDGTWQRVHDATEAANARP